MIQRFFIFKLLFLFLFLSLGITSCSRLQEQATLWWELRQLETEREHAAAAGKKLLLFASADWCTFCDRLKETFKNPKVAKILADHFVIHSLDVDQPNQELIVQNYHIKGVPGLVVLLDSVDKPLPILLETKNGVYPAKDLQTKLELAKEGKDELTLLLAEWKTLTQSERTAQKAITIGKEYSNRLNEEKTIEWMERAYQIDHNPNKETGVWAWYHLGFMFYQLGMYDNERALTYYDRIIAQHPTNSAAANSASRKAKILAQNDDASAGKETFTNLIQQAPENYLARYYFGNFCLKYSEDCIDTAATLLEDVRNDKDKDRIYLLPMLAKLYQHQNDCGQARTTAKIAVNADHENSYYQEVYEETLECGQENSSTPSS